MLTVTKKGVWEDRYHFSRDEEEVARLITGVWPRKGKIETGKDEIAFRRNGYFTGPFICEKNGAPIARAEKPSAFRDHFIITVGDLTFEIAREERFGSKLTVRWDDEEIGTIAEGKKKVHAIVDLPDSLPLELQVFFFGLAQILWDRHAIIGALGG